MVDPESRWSLARPGILISEEAPALSVLRLARDDTASGARLAKALNLAWPETPNTVWDGPPRVAWMAPGQWAIFAAGADLEGRVTKACGRNLHHLADVTAGRRLWRLQGLHARTVIAQGCGIDIDPGVMSDRRCARTLFAQAPVLLIGSATGDAFEIVADVSFAGHLRAWFADATLEWLQ